MRLRTCSGEHQKYAQYDRTWKRRAAAKDSCNDATSAPPPSFRLFVSYNRRIAAGSESQVSGYFTKNPTAIVEVNGISGDEDEDSGQDPDFLEGMILEFMLTRCPVGKLYKDFKSQSWANESLARRGSLSINGDRSAAHHCVYWNASYLCALFF